MANRFVVPRTGLPRGSPLRMQPGGAFGGLRRAVVTTYRPKRPACALPAARHDTAGTSGRTQSRERSMRLRGRVLGLLTAGAVAVGAAAVGLAAAAPAQAATLTQVTNFGS